jgi:tripartite-type tricarboxylate transporter receptor subunit TctC
MNKFKGVLVTLLGGAAMLIAAGAHAQFPSKPLRIIVPFSAGGSTDVLARTVAIHLESRLGQSVVVENKPGGATVIGASAVAKAAADAHMILLASDITFAINPHVLASSPFDPLKDLAAITIVGTAPNWIVMRADSKERDLASLVERIRKNPGQVNMSVNTIGGTAHLVLSAWAKRNNLNVTIVPYPGVGKAIPDLLGGHLQAIVDVVGGTAPFVKDGKMIPVALLHSQPSPLAADVAPYTAAGQKDMDVVTTFAFFTTGGSPKQDVERLNREIAAILRLPDVAEKLKILAIDPLALSPADSDAYIRAQHARFGKIVAETGFKAQ